MHGKEHRETTQFEDILVERGILQEDVKVREWREQVEEAKKRGEKPKPTTQDLLERAAQRGGDALDKLEDEAEMAGDEEERILEQLRRARLQEMKREAARARYGEAPMLARDEFIPAVKESSATGGLGGEPQHVVIELVKQGMERSEATSQCIDRLARANPDTKFVRMVSDHCIENWPDSRVPAVFVYYKGSLSGQLVGWTECGAGDDDLLRAALAVLGVQLKHASAKSAERAREMLMRHGDGGGSEDSDSELRRPRGRQGKSSAPSKRRGGGDDDDDDW